MIVAISQPGDRHATAVLAALRARGARAVLLDLAEIPRRGRIALRYGRGGGERLLATRAAAIRARDVTAVWWRRPRALVADPRLGAASAGFAVRQSAEALMGLASILDARWVNDPWREAVANRKAHQLAAAEREGLPVPRTLVTNDAARARAFIRAGGRGGTVHKALAATPEDWRPTRLVAPDDVRRLSAIRHAPVVLQEYVPGVDVRVTVVGRALFAAAIDARATRSPEDFRPAFDDARVAPCTLPADVARRLRALVAALGLRYAAVDLRRRDDGEHVFLEANPAGQWLFVERRTGQPITEAVARLLAGR
ncbi:MAG TPA: alpha-L-glutamate ligase [Anaeromyxobacter sp.]|nr:alpha-L-glutamate ligase [Anaeromyxobacter sp.]